MIDDPNLHALGYGHVSYPTLARACGGTRISRGHGDDPSRRRVRFARRRCRSSVLGVPSSRCSCTAMTTFAASSRGRDRWRTLLRWQRRLSTGSSRSSGARRVRVSRVMAPPHSACSIIGARGMLRAGFAALCTTPAPRAPDADVSLADWRRAEFVAGGLPNISRHHLNGSRDDLAFRALLGQPLVLYFHHEDLADGARRTRRRRPRRSDVRCRALDAGRRSRRNTVHDDRRGPTPRSSGSSRAGLASPCQKARSGSSSSCPGHDEWQHEVLELSHVGRDRPLEAAVSGGSRRDRDSRTRATSSSRYGTTTQLAPGTVAYRRSSALAAAAAAGHRGTRPARAQAAPLTGGASCRTSHGLSCRR